MMDILNDLGGNVIPIVAILMPVGIVGITSYFGHKRTELVHRERMAAIERGLMPKGTLGEAEREEDEAGEANSAPNYLRRGLFWFCPGAGMVAFSLLFLSDVPLGVRLPILGVSVVCAGVGAAHLVIYMFENEKSRHYPPEGR
jgi:hypothetical protein